MRLTTPAADILDFRPGASESARCLRAIDWACTPLGSIAGWSSSLRAAVGLCLDWPAPACLAWGPGRVLFYNDGCAPLFGDRHPLAFGRDFADCALAAQPAIADAFRRAAAGEAVCLAEQPLPVAAGGRVEEHVYAIAFTPIRDQTGAVAGVFQALTDITAPARAACAGARGSADSEAALREANRRLNVVLESVSDVFIALDRSWRIAGINDRALALTGRPREQVLGRNVWETFPEYRDSEIEAALRAAMRDRKPVRREIYGAVSLRWFELSIYPSDDGLSVFGRDIDDRKRAEQRLRDSEERFAQFMQHLPGMAWLKDPEGRLLYVNDAAVKGWGVPRERLLGRTLAGTFAPATDDQCRSSDAAAARTPAGVQVLESYHNAAGELRHVLVSKFPVPEAAAGGTLIGGIAIDVTERKQAEEALRESEERLRLALRGANAGVWRSDVATGETFWSEEFEPLYGFDARTPRTYETWLARLHPDDRERVKAEFRARLKSAVTEFQYEFRIVHPSRGVRWILDLGRVERDARGRARSFSGINLDITERKQAEEALRRERELLQTIFNRIPVMITLYDPEVRMLRVNRAFERATGWSSEDAARVSIMDACYPDPAYRAEVQAFMDSCRDGWMDIRMRTRDGRDIETSWANIRLSDHTQIGIGIDITERRRAEERLRNSERLYRAIGESIDYGVWVCDPAGRNIYASESFLRLVGQTQEECSEFGWGDVLHPDDAQRTIAAWKECVRSGEQWDIEHRFRGVDGQWHPVLARGVPVRNERGEITAWAGINLDIGRLKQVEEELREADRRKDQFLATLAHELRNPLAPLRNGLEIMRLAGENRQALAQARGMMERQLTHLVRLVDDLLDLSRISRGRIDLRREPVDLAVVVRHALETSRPGIEQAGHELSVRVPPEPVLVEADTIRLAQALANLLNNAAKYTERGGHIRLSVARRDGHAEVSVRDNGVGIPPAQLPYVFEMFSRVDRPLGRAHGGLGIGLSIVKHLIEMHGGTVEALSAGDGQGSEFRLRLPLLPDVGAPWTRDPEDQAASSAKRSGRRVLVADDNADAAASLAALLELLGNDVRVARDGREAAEIAAWFRPELALLDLGMPRLDGCGACREIRALPGAGQMTIVALTGWGQEDDKRRSQASGFDQHLVKPVEPAVLERLLATLPR